MNWATYFGIYLAAAFLSGNYKEKIFDSIVWIAVLPAVFFIIQKFFSSHPPSDITTWGLLPKKNIFNALVSCGLLIVMADYFHRSSESMLFKSGLKKIVIFLLLMCSWIFSFTVSGIIGFIFAVVVMIGSEKKHLRRISVVSGLILLVVMLSVKLSQPNVWDRLVWYKAAVEMFLAHPVSGVGVGRFAELVGGYIGKTSSGILRSYYAHSFYLEILAETGVIGFSLIAIVFYFAVKNSFKNDIRTLVVSIFIMVMGLTDFIFNFPLIPIILFTALGSGGEYLSKSDDKGIKIKTSYGYVAVFMVILYSLFLIAGAVVKYNLWYKDYQKSLLEMRIVK